MLPLHQSHIKVKNFGNSTFTAYILKSTNAISHVLFLTNTLNTPEFHCFLFVSSYNTPSNIPVLIAVLYPNVSSDMGTRQTQIHKCLFYS